MVEPQLALQMMKGYTQMENVELGQVRDEEQNKMILDAKVLQKRNKRILQENHLVLGRAV